MKEQPLPDDAFVLDLRGISKRFGDLWANRDIDLRVHRGECHAVVGENGAGKSTLMQVLFGRWKPDRGEIRIGGTRRFFSSSRDAVRAGLGMVHQQLLVFPQLTALENILVGVHTRRGLFLRRKQAGRAVQQLSRSFGFDLPLETMARDLSFAHRQQIELVRTLYRGAEILILDEPTSLLSPPEVGRLLSLLQSLKARGHTLLFVSHRLSEVFALADHITVLRRGEKVGTFDAELSSPEEIARLMFVPQETKSSAVSSPEADGVSPGRETSRRSAKRRLLEMRTVCAPLHRNEAGIEKLDLVLSEGEILGVGGIVGNGQRTLARVIAGQVPMSSGRLFFDGEDWSGLSIRQRLDRGLRWLPANLLEEGFCPGLTLWENHLLGRQNQPRFQTGGWLHRGAVRDWTRSELMEGEVRFSSVDDPVETLSGGNTQRMGLLRALGGAPRLVLLEQPGRGLDIGGQEWLRLQVRRLSEAGTAFLVISYDLDELVSLCHGIGILYRGRMMGVAPPEGSARETLVRWMTGIGA